MSLSFPLNPTVGQVYSFFTWNGTAWVSSGAPAAPQSGSRVLLSTQTLSAAVASVAFTNAAWFSNAYDSIEIEAIQYNLSVDNGNLIMQVSQNGGATWDTGSSYIYLVIVSTSLGSSGGAGYNNGFYVAYAPWGNIATFPNLTLHGTARLWRPWSNGISKNLTHNSCPVTTGGTYLYTTYGHGGYPASAIGGGGGVLTPINAVRLLNDAGGNITRGTFKLYGWVA